MTLRLWPHEKADGLQTVLETVGTIPAAGNLFDLANAGISLARGNYADAGSHLLSALPGGQVFTAARIAKKIGKVVDKGKLAGQRAPYMAVNTTKIRKYFDGVLMKRFRKSGGRIIEHSKPKGNLLGGFNSVKNEIHLFPGHNSGTIAEELLHFEQARRLGILGKQSFGELGLLQRVEQGIPNLMRRGGYAPAR